MTNKDDHQWIEVHAGSVTSANSGSPAVAVLPVEGPPICPNMTDSDFRTLVIELRDEAVSLTRQRIAQLMHWSPESRARVTEWFGTANSLTRDKLLRGLQRLLVVMPELTAKNFVRQGSPQDRATGCLPNMKNLSGVTAHVCAPDVATHTIAIHVDFCLLPDRSAGHLSSKQLTLVHECSHFFDTFGAEDIPLGYGRSACKELAKRHPELAIRNADSIAWFILAR